jgi:hypothetical protein
MSSTSAATTITHEKQLMRLVRKRKLLRALVQASAELAGLVVAFENRMTAITENAKAPSGQTHRPPHRRDGPKLARRLRTT